MTRLSILRGALRRAAVPVAAAVVMSAAGCSAGDTYTIDAVAEGLGTQNLNMVYVGDDAVHTTQTTALDDRFTFKGKLDRPAQMDIYAGSGALLARMIVSPGEHIELKLDVKDYGKSVVKGSDATARLIGFLADNDDAARLNAAVEAYVGTHRDDPVSAVLVTAYYDTRRGSAAVADSLLGLIEARARSVVAVESYAMQLKPAIDAERDRVPARLRLRTTTADSLVAVDMRDRRRTLLAIQDMTGRPDLKRAVEADTKAVGDDVRLIEVTLAPDSLQWRLALQADTVPGKWINAFTPAGVLDPALKPLKVMRLPCYIVSDSTGRTLCRTSDVTEALGVLAGKRRF